jgi:hypothetical protein
MVASVSARASPSVATSVSTAKNACASARCDTGTSDTPATAADRPREHRCNGVEAHHGGDANVHRVLGDAVLRDVAPAQHREVCGERARGQHRLHGVGPHAALREREERWEMRQRVGTNAVERNEDHALRGHGIVRHGRHGELGAPGDDDDQRGNRAAE